MSYAKGADVGRHIDLMTGRCLSPIALYASNRRMVYAYKSHRMNGHI